MTDERFKQVRMMYHRDPNFSYLVNKLLDLMEDFRFSNGDHADQYEQIWQEAILMAEAIHGADEANACLDEIIEARQYRVESPCGDPAHDVYGAECPCTKIHDNQH